MRGLECSFDALTIVAQGRAMLGRTEEDTGTRNDVMNDLKAQLEESANVKYGIFYSMSSSL
jgi:hypothetical protein